MVTNYGGTGDLMCSSTDVKPTDVAVNTRCLELDTGKFWYFNGTSWTETPGGGGGGSATLIEKNVTANGTYTASDDDADGYSSVEVDVPNTYTVDDNGKVVSNQTLVAQTAKPDTITVNDTYNTTEYNSVTVNVPNTYTVADEGKVVSSGALVSQSAYPSTITANNTYDTTNYNSIAVNVSGDNSDLINLIERDITSIDIPSGVTRIGSSAFNSCTSLTSVTIPSGVTSIDIQAFYNCTSLTSVTIPSSVTRIGFSAFANCNSLASLTIPSGVTSIDVAAFQSCIRLTSITFESDTPPTVANANAWTGIPTTCTIYVPTGSLSAYTSASNYPDPNTYTYVEY